MLACQRLTNRPVPLASVAMRFFQPALMLEDFHVRNSFTLARRVSGRSLADL
jgi:hypothetical protein